MPTYSRKKEGAFKHSGYLIFFSEESLGWYLNKKVTASFFLPLNFLKSEKSLNVIKDFNTNVNFI